MIHQALTGATGLPLCVQLKRRGNPKYMKWKGETVEPYQHSPSNQNNNNESRKQTKKPVQPAHVQCTI